MDVVSLLCTVSEEEADRYPELRDEITIRRIATPEDLIIGIADRFPLLPSSYFEVIRELDLFGVSLGPFCFSCKGLGAADLLQSLELFNCDNDPSFEFVNPAGLTKIGEWDIDTLACSPNGEIMFLSLSDQPGVIEFCNSSFESLLETIVALRQSLLTSQVEEHSAEETISLAMKAVSSVEGGGARVWKELISSMV